MCDPGSFRLDSRFQLDRNAAVILAVAFVLRDSNRCLSPVILAVGFVLRDSNRCLSPVILAVGFVLRDLRRVFAGVWVRFASFTLFVIIVCISTTPMVAHPEPPQASPATLDYRNFCKASLNPWLKLGRFPTSLSCQVFWRGQGAQSRRKNRFGGCLRPDAFGSKFVRAKKRWRRRELHPRLCFLN